jgi:hypothetical protein
MKLAILSESPADEAALGVLVAAALGGPFSRVAPNLRARGWPSVIQVMPSILRHLHFNTDADGLVVVVDADDSVAHTEAHEAEGYFHPRCRLCQLRAVFRRTVKNLPERRSRGGLLRAAGVAVPAIEAWYLCGRPRDGDVTERAWSLNEERRPYTRAQLKFRVYGTERPGLQQETERALEEARRLARDLRRLEHDFPSFDALSRDLKGWGRGGKS